MKNQAAQQVKNVNAISRGSRGQRMKPATGWQGKKQRMETKKRATGRRKQTLRNTKGTEVKLQINSCSRRQGRKRWLFHHMSRGFKDQAGQIEGQRKGVADEHGFCGVAQSKGWRTFELSAGLGGIATLGIRLSADAQLPSIRTNLHVTCQPDGAIGQRERGTQRKSKVRSMIRLGERTSLA